jgi:16S rRNA (adenine1518-N6/adenine1519-N6)-dimethyltransferase
MSHMATHHLPKKSLGQHWLEDADSLQAMMDAAKLSTDDLVVEIGPGPGSLTKLLAEKARQVVAVELDDKLVDQLRRRAVSNVEIVHGDILRFDFTSLPPDYKIVANIPYYLTSNLIRTMSETSNPPAVAVLLVQREVAERVAAKPGQMSLLSVTAQFYWQVSLGQIVAAELFTPPPKVDSQILILKKRSEPLFPDVEAKDFFRLVKAGFAQKRKTLLNNLINGLQLSRDEVTKSCAKAGIDPGRRAQTLSLEEWHKIYQASR